MDWEEGVERSTDGLDADEVQDLEMGKNRKRPLNGLRMLLEGCKIDKLGLDLSDTRLGLLDVIAFPRTL